MDLAISQEQARMVEQEVLEEEEEVEVVLECLEVLEDPVELDTSQFRYSDQYERRPSY